MMGLSVSRPRFNSIRTLVAGSPLLFVGALLVMAPPAFCVEEVSITDAPLKQHNYEMTFSTGLRAMQGAFDPYGQYQAFPDGSKAYGVSSNLSVNYRFSSKWEADMGVPFSHSEMNFPTGSTSSYSIGGLLGGARYHIGTPFHLVAHASLVAPWQINAKSLSGASLPDSMGNGGTSSAGSFHMGIGGSHAIGQFRFTTDVGVYVPFTVSQVSGDALPGSAPDSVQASKRYVVSQGAAYRISDRWAADISFHESWAGLTTLNGTPVQGTAGRSLSTSLGAMYAPPGNWHYSASYDTQAPFYSYEVAGSYSPALSFIVAYNGF
jgi:hypothetical protein